MARFKAGDRVRILAGHPYGGLPDNPHGTVENADGKINGYRGKFEVAVDGYQLLTFKGRELELLPEAEAWVPKVGDRVNWTRVRGEFDGSIIEAHEGLVYDFKLRATNGSHTYAFKHELEPAPLTIEPGKFYRTRDGRKVGPALRDTSHGFGKDFPWRVGVYTYTDGGRVGFIEDRNDLVAEWVEPVDLKAEVDSGRMSVNDARQHVGLDPLPEPAAPPAKFNVGDRVKHKSLGYIGKVDRIVDEKYVGTTWDVPVGWSATDPIDDLEPAPTPVGAAPTTPPTNFIVARLTSRGAPRPNARPRVHTTLASAETEAQRLADRLGDEFAVYQRVSSKTVDAGPVPSHFGRLRDVLDDHQSVGGAFTWANTRQGWQFWSEYQANPTPLGRAILRKWIAEVEAGQGAAQKEAA